MEEKSQIQRDFMEQLMESSSSPMFVLDSQHRIIVWNRALAELTGLSRNEMLNTNRQWEAFYAEARPTLADLVLTGETHRLSALYTQFGYIESLPHIIRAEGWFPKVNGQRRYLFFDVAPVFAPDGRMIAVVETLHDITDRKQGEEALRLYQQAVDQSASSIVITDPAGNIIYVNNKFCTLTGYSREEAIGQNPRILKSGHQPPEVYVDLWQTITAGQPWHGEFRNRRKDGSFYWELVNITPLFDDQGGTTHFLAVKEDISPRKEAEYKLRKQQAELVVKHEQLSNLYKLVEIAKQEWEGTMDCIGDMVLLVGAKGKIIRCNRAVVEFTGKAFSELQAAAWWEVLFSGEMDLGQLQGETGELFHRPSGRWFYLNSYSFLQGEITNSVITLHDLTEVKRVSQELTTAYDELKSTHMQLLQQEKMASIGQLAAGVAHEINNPMGFISSNLMSLGKYVDRLKAYIETQSAALANAPAETVERLATEKKKLKIDYLLEDIPKLLTESTDGADRVRTIVQNLKSFSRVDESELKEANLIECLDSTVSIAWNELKYTCTVEKEYGDIPFIKCHPQQLNQVFLNLLVNGAHAIATQGIIRIRTWQEGDMVCVAISDTGSGIPEEIRTRIFEPFFTTKAVGKGTGLGLSISYDIVKKHGGTIDLQSALGEGTTFTVRLPIAGPPAEPREGS